MIAITISCIHFVDGPNLGSWRSIHQRCQFKVSRHLDEKGTKSLPLFHKSPCEKRPGVYSRGTPKGLFRPRTHNNWPGRRTHRYGVQLLFTLFHYDLIYIAVPTSSFTLVVDHKAIFYKKKSAGEIYKSGISFSFKVCSRWYLRQRCVYYRTQLLTCSLSQRRQVPLADKNEQIM